IFIFKNDIKKWWRNRK
ncbi:hypothetical protein B8W94_14100, partial [Lactococcus lactis]